MTRRIPVAYVCAPYRADTEYEVLQNIRRAEAIAVRLWRMGFAVVCPHLNTAHLGGIVPDEAILAGDIAILLRCDVLVLPGTVERTTGMRGEIAAATRVGIECRFESVVSVWLTRWNERQEEETKP